MISTHAHVECRGSKDICKLENSTFAITFFSNNRSCFSSHLCYMTKQHFNVNFCLADIISFNVISTSFNMIFVKGI